VAFFEYSVRTPNSRKTMLKKVLCLLALLWAHTTFAAVEVNRVDATTLQSIKGIGRSVASKIVAERHQGAFTDWPNLVQRVKGIGHATAIKLSQEGLTVNGLGYTPGAVVRVPKHSRHNHTGAAIIRDGRKKQH
jgi:competence protein ComEA